MLIVSSKLHRRGRRDDKKAKDKTTRERAMPHCSIFPPLLFYIQLCRRVLLFPSTVCTEKQTYISRGETGLGVYKREVEEVVW